MSVASRRAVGLWILLALFCLRVFGQLLVGFVPIAFLPAFEEWDSGALPYPALVFVQFVIIVVYAMMAWRIGRGKTEPSRRAGVWLLGIGSVYFALMLGRLMLGLTALEGHPWFDKPIPSFFHLVLAGFLLVAGHFHASAQRRSESR